MDIKELQDYRLSDAVKFHTHLNPKIWGPDEHLLPEVREKLLAIAADFKEFLGLNLEVKDITISGSNAAYTYSDHSDIDLHLVADLPKADANELYRELFDAKKYQYNDQHNFTIGGYPVELYVQNINEAPKSQGIYSLLNNDWISVPKRRKPDIDDISVKSKYEDLGHRIDAAIKSGDVKQLDALGKKVREFRQAGLDQTGEFGPENLAFKVLRSNGTLDRLRDARLAAKDRELSVDEAQDKTPVKYGFKTDDYYFPGYHYYGQTGSTADGGDPEADAGTEDVKESADNIQAQLEKFAAFCSKKLGIENPPRIQIKRDPEWSKRNATFGRYVPEVKTLVLSVANRHPMDIMRTLAHELVHRRQDEIEPMPGHAGDTGSKWENQANAQAGVLMRDWGAMNPGMFDKKPLGEASGYIPVNDTEAKDPRWSMAITQDIKPGEPKRQAAKMGWKTTAAGTPPTSKTNGLIESLQRKLQQVKAGTLNEEQLDEVNMSPGALQSWAKEHAAGMKSGFEAELIFKDLLGPSEDEDFGGDMEPDYDQDERADSIEDIINFFSAEMTNTQEDRLRRDLVNEYMEWRDDALMEEFEDRAYVLVKEYIEDNDWNWQEKIAEYLQDTMGKTQAESEAIMDQGEENDDGSENEDYVFAMREVEDQLKQRVENTIRAGFEYDDYQAAYDEFASEPDSNDEQAWLRSQSIRYMSDASDSYNIDWPHWRPVDNGSSADGEYQIDNAEILAKSLRDTLGVKTQVESGTRGASAKSRTPSDVWVFEADGSLHPDSTSDMPVEIVSPPMPLEKTLEIMPKFFEWASSQGAYANKSTGLHMSVSMPEHAGGNLDYTKAALFLGDQYVLEQFGRTAQSYCQSALKQIKIKIDQKRKNLIPADNEVTKAFNQMRTKLNSIATQAFAQPGGYGKYFSINPKDKYIEFRSAGGKDYIEDIPKLQNTMLRYARAMSIGMDPDAEKAEYAKKLYKLLGNVELQQNPADKSFGPTNKTTSGSVSAKPGEKSAIWYFTQYAAGELTESDLKKVVKQLQGERAAAKQAKQGDVKMWYRVSKKSYAGTEGSLQTEVIARSPLEAISVARKKWNIPSSTHPNFTSDDFIATPLRPLTAADTATVGSPQNSADQSFTAVVRGRNAAGDEPAGPIIHQITAASNIEVRQELEQWLRDNNLIRSNYWITINPQSRTQDYRFTYDSQSNPTGNYVIRRRDPDSNTATGPVIYRFRGDDADDAVEQARAWMMSRGISRSELWLATSESTPTDILNNVPGAPAAASPSATQDQPPSSPRGMPASDPEGNWVIRNRDLTSNSMVDAARGPILYQFRAEGNTQAIATAREYARLTGIDRPYFWLQRYEDVPAEFRPRPEQDDSRIRPPTIGRPDDISDTGYWILFDGDSLDNLALFPAITSQDAQRAFQQWIQAQGYILGSDLNYYMRAANSNDVGIARRDGFHIPPRMPADSPQTLAPSDPSGNWGIRAAGEGSPILYQFNAPNGLDASRRIQAWADATGLDSSIFRAVRIDPGDRAERRSIPEVPIDIAQNFQEPPASWDSGTPAARPGHDRDTRETSTSGRWYIVDANTGEVVHDFELPPRANRDYAEQQAAAWQRMTGYDDPYRVYADD